MFLRRYLPFCFVASLLCSCAGQRNSPNPSASRTRVGCAAGPVAGFDSTFAVGQAERGLTESGSALKVRSIQPVLDEGIELGVLISFVSSRNMVGGGGLVYFDLETGCATVLRRYE